MCRVIAPFSLAWKLWKRRIPWEVKEILFEMQIMDDLKQEIETLVAEMPKNDLREASCFLQRGFYNFLKTWGFTRPKNSKSFVAKIKPQDDITFEISFPSETTLFFAMCCKKDEWEELWDWAHGKDKLPPEKALAGINKIKKRLEVHADGQ